MGTDPFKVLFLCTGNSARSVMAEAILDQLGERRFLAYSAGSHPVGHVNPVALAVLRGHGYDPGGLNSKSWDAFAGDEAPAFDFVITVCDQAAGETCPLWPGQPLRVHWGLPDPATATGSDEAVRRAFEATYSALSARIGRLIELPLESMSTTQRLTALSAVHAGQGPA